MNQVNAPTPMRNVMSPTMRNQRSAWIQGCCRNSALRANQTVSMLA